ncbi:hypothetical protein [Paenibacillus sp. GCM10012306]
MEIKMLNQQLEVENQEIELMISELVERGELACTGNACGAQAEGL